jgi:hypothetical protein
LGVGIKVIWVAVRIVTGPKSVDIRAVKLIIDRKQVVLIRKRMIEHESHPAIIGINITLRIVQIPWVVANHPRGGPRPGPPKLLIP